MECQANSQPVKEEREIMDVSDVKASAINSDSFRLPRNLKPIRYELEIKTFLDSNLSMWPAEKDDTFEGSVNISFKCVDPTEKIVFHSKGLNLKRFRLTPNINIESFTVQDDTDFVILKLDQNCQIEKEYTLNILFSNNLDSQLFGYYKRYFWCEKYLDLSLDLKIYISYTLK
jgi:hypothetical protein